MRITLTDEQKAHCRALGIEVVPDVLEVADHEWRRAIGLWKRVGSDIDHELKAVGHLAWQKCREVANESEEVVQQAVQRVEAVPVSTKLIERLLGFIAFLILLLLLVTAFCGKAQAQWSQIKTVTFQNSDNTVAGLAAGPFTIRPSSGTWSRSGTTWTLTVTAASGAVAWDAITNPVGGGLSLTQFANGNTFLAVKRKTDTTPTGSFFDFQNAAGSSLCKLDITGTFVGCSFPYANLSGVPALPVNTTATGSQWFTAYNSTTGAFTKSQPAFGDISGAATTAQLPGTGATTVNGVACTLGSTCTVADSTKVPTSTTVNGHALSANVTVTATDVGLGSVTNDAQTKAAIVPNTAPSSAQLLIGNAGGTAYAPTALSQDCTVASTGAITCTKTNNVAFAASATTDATNAANIGSGTLPAGRLPAQYKIWSCESGLGDGLNAVTAGTYLQSFCFNTTGVTVTLTAVKCYTDNAGSSTLNAAGNTLGALLTGAVTCSSTIASGTQSANVALTNGDYVKFTWVADGASKQSTWVVTGTY